jgi:GTPase SAR1 family protein
LVDRKSFERVEKVWVPEILKANSKMAFIIVGSKLDIRNDEKACELLKVKPVTKEEGINLTKKVGGLEYRECSAKTQDGLGDVFQAAVRAAISPDQCEFFKSEKKKKFLGLF